jgi:hypothetical protein
LLERAEHHRLPRSIVEEELVLHLAIREAEKLFDTIVAWGRFAELLSYSPQTEELSLFTPQTEEP